MRLPKEEAALRAGSLSLPAARAHSAMSAPGHEYSDQSNLLELLASPTVRQVLRPVAEKLLSLSQSGAVFCVCSARSGEGKTLVATVLSLILSEGMGKSVLLVDAHLQRPCVHRLLGVPDSPGLADCLREERSLQDAVNPVGTLGVLPSGGDGDPARLFRTAAARRLIEEMRETYDLAIVDLPPLTPSNEEAAALCDWSDGAIMVVRANATSASAIKEAVRMIDPPKMLGVVLNREQPELPPWLQRLL
jgi:Mrp family chromosome partitioning ATPase